MHFLEDVSSVSGKGRVEENILVLVIGVKCIHIFTRFLFSLLLHLLYKSRLLIPQTKSATTAINCYTASAIFWLIFPSHAVQ